jgi:hypothetical protein
VKFFKKTLIVVGSLLVFFGVLIVADNVSYYTSPESEIVVDTTTIPVFEKQPEVAYGMIVDGLSVSSFEVKRNQRFSDLLDGFHVDGRAMRLLAMLPRNVFDFRKLRPTRNTP